MDYPMCFCKDFITSAKPVNRVRKNGKYIQVCFTKSVAEDIVSAGIIGGVAILTSMFSGMAAAAALGITEYLLLKYGVENVPAFCAHLLFVQTSYDPFGGFSPGGYIVKDFWKQ